MPLTSKGEKIMKAMKAQYGSDKKAEEVFYASKNAGKITGVEQRQRLALEAARLRQQMFPHLARPGR